MYTFGGDAPAFRKIINSKNTKSCVFGDISLTKFANGEGKLTDYCAFADEAGEYLQLDPTERGWRAVKRASKPISALPIDLKDAKLVHKNGEFEYYDLPGNNSVINLREVKESDIGYPFGPNPFDVESLKRMYTDGLLQRHNPIGL